MTSRIQEPLREVCLSVSRYGCQCMLDRGHEGEHDPKCGWGNHKWSDPSEANYPNPQQDSRCAYTYEEGFSDGKHVAIRDMRPAAVVSDAGVVEGIFSNYHAALRWAEDHRMGVANICGGVDAPFTDVQFSAQPQQESERGIPEMDLLVGVIQRARMYPPHVTPRTILEDELKALRETTARPHAAMAKAQPQQETGEYMRSSLLYPDTNKMPQPRTPFIRKEER